MDWLPAELAVELPIRVAATAAIIIGITLAVERLGPAIGGALVGLPIVIGPGFFFLLREHGAEFGAEAAASSLISLCATEAFLLVYCAAAARWSAGISIACASATWFAAAFVLSPVPSRPGLGLLLFVAAAVFARRTARRFLRAGQPRAAKGGAFLLLVRGLAAGILVAAATLTADRLGPGWSGFVVTYPIGFTVVSITIHQRSGADTAIATLHGAMLGVISLAAFSFTLAATAGPLGSGLAFLGALAAGVAATGLLTWRTALVVAGSRGKP